MPSDHLASDLTVTQDVWTTVLSLSLDPGIWILMGSMLCYESGGSASRPIAQGRFFDGESTFFGSGSEGRPWQNGSPNFDGGMTLTFLGVADLSAASVATTVYMQVLGHDLGGGTETWKVLTSSWPSSAYAATWFIATEFGGSGGVSFPPPPSTITSGTAHTGLTGSGSFTLTSPNNGVEIDATTIPAGWGFADWSPTHYIPAWCEIAWDAAAGVARTDLVHESLVVLFQPFAAANEVFYSIKPGWVATITEVEGA
jgi:hypothetical protein